jgi:hypothetical protein
MIAGLSNSAPSNSGQLISAKPLISFDIAKLVL